MPSFVSTIIIAATVAAQTTSSAAQASDPSAQAVRSATKARDIGGFRLGMNIREANKIAKVQPIGSDQFETEHEGKSYNFGLTPRGRIYRVQSSQPLGRFAVDHVFTQSLAAKLTEKYGPPGSRTDTTFNWGLVEPVKDVSGTVRPFRTMWLAAHVSGGPGVDEVSLEMTMIDFRILWQDEAELNRAPRDEAATKIDF